MMSPVNIGDTPKLEKNLLNLMKKFSNFQHLRFDSPFNFAVGQFFYRTFFFVTMSLTRLVEYFWWKMLNLMKKLSQIFSARDLMPPLFFGWAILDKYFPATLMIHLCSWQKFVQFDEKQFEFSTFVILTTPSISQLCNFFTELFFFALMSLIYMTRCFCRKIFLDFYCRFNFFCSKINSVGFLFFKGFPKLYSGNHESHRWRGRGMTFKIFYKDKCDNFLLH